MAILAQAWDSAARHGRVGVTNGVGESADGSVRPDENAARKLLSGLLCDLDIGRMLSGGPLRRTPRNGRRACVEAASVEATMKEAVPSGGGLLEGCEPSGIFLGRARRRDWALRGGAEGGAERHRLCTRASGDRRLPQNHQRSRGFWKAAARGRKEKRRPLSGARAQRRGQRERRPREKRPAWTVSPNRSRRVPTKADSYRPFLKEVKLKRLDPRRVRATE